MKGFKNTNIYVDGIGVIKTSLAFDDGVIKSIGKDTGEGFTEIPEDYIVVPGFIDEHIHGCDGYDTMEATPKGIQEMARQLLQEGVTYFCPTTMSMKVTQILKAIHNIERARIENDSGAEILGIHLEGPFLSEKYCGAQDSSLLLDCSKAIMKDFIDSSDKDIRIVSFAYERNGKEILPLLVAEGITPSLGHSDASAEETKEAIKGGARCATHTYNAMRGLHHRDVGLLGSVMLSDQVMCELIADLKHVSEDAIRLLFKTKGKERVILISDSMEAKYLPDGTYALGGQKVYVKDRAARLENGVLAGSVLRLDDAMKNIHKVIPELSFTDVIDLVTKNPAKNLNIGDIGAIKVGNKARFTVVDRDFNVIKTIF